MDRNVSTKLFRSFCKDNDIRCDPVPCEQTEKTPDFDVFPRRNKVAIEVKELRKPDSENPVDDPAKRLRRIIKSGYSQIKKRTKGLYPGLIIIYDNESGQNVESTDIKNAMYGQETIKTQIDTDTGSIVGPTNGYQGKDKICTELDNKSLSGVALLRYVGLVSQLDIFFNIHSDAKLPTGWFRFQRCSQFSIRLERHGQIPTWHEI